MYCFTLNEKVIIKYPLLNWLYISCVESSVVTHLYVACIVYEKEVISGMPFCNMGLFKTHVYSFLSPKNSPHSIPEDDIPTPWERIFFSLLTSCGVNVNVSFLKYVDKLLSILSTSLNANLNIYILFIKHEWLVEKAFFVFF